jgi:hypothetical protein
MATATQPTRTDTLFKDQNLTATLDKLEALEKRQVDLIVPREAVRAEGGLIHVTAGPNNPDMVIKPNWELISTMSGRLGLPAPLLREVEWRALNPRTPEDPSDPLAVAEVEGEAAAYTQWYDSMLNARLRYDAPKRFMLRTYKPTRKDAPYVGRAMLSDRYFPASHVDATYAFMDACNELGISVEEGDVTADLTDANFFIRVRFPQIHTLAPEFLEGYVNPWTGEPGDPIIHAGLVMRNSEVGMGAYMVAPQVVVKVCTNGLTVAKDAIKRAHAGRLNEAEGLFTRSEDTRRLELELLRSQTKDAITSYLTPDWLIATVNGWSKKASRPLAEPATVIEVVAKRLGWTADEKEGILNRFITGKQNTAGAVAQALTAHAKEVPSPERAFALEAMAPDAIEAAAANAKVVAKA